MIDEIISAFSSGDISAIGPIIGAIAGAMLVFLLLILLAIYVYQAFALMTIAKRTKTKRPWLAWIPIANFYLIVDIAKVPKWTFFAFFLLLIPVIGSWAFAAVFIWWIWKVCERRKRPGWWAILTIVPLFGSLWLYIVYGILAWSKK